MRIDMVGAVLSIILDRENSGVIPVRTAGDGLAHSAKGKAIVRHRSGGTRLASGGAVSVVVGEIQQDQGWQFASLPFLASADKTFKLVEEFVGAKLVRIFGVEVRELWIEVVAQHILGRLGALQHWNRPWPGTH